VDRAVAALLLLPLQLSPPCYRNNATTTMTPITIRQQRLCCRHCQEDAAVAALLLLPLQLSLLRCRNDDDDDVTTMLLPLPRLSLPRPSLMRTTTTPTTTRRQRDDNLSAAAAAITKTTWSSPLP
jgi:hypothetical protein